MIGYMLFKNGLPYIEDKPERTRFYVHNPFYPSNTGIGGLCFPYGVLIKSDNRHCIYSYTDSNGNHVYEYLTNGNTEVKTVNIDDNASLCTNKYQNQPHIPDMLTKNLVLSANNTYYLEGDGFIFCEYYTNINNEIRYDNAINYQNRTYTGSYNTNAISAINGGDVKLKVKVDTDELWNRLGISYSGDIRNLTETRRSDEWLDTGNECSWGLVRRLLGQVTSPNYRNGEFINSIYNNKLIGRAFIGLNVDLVDNDKQTLTNNFRWSFADIHPITFAPGKTKGNLSDFTVFGDNESPDTSFIYPTIENITEVMGTQVNTVTYGIPICTTWDEVVDWLDNGVLPDGWNEDDEDIDTTGQSEPNDGDSIEDNQGTTPTNYSLSGVDLYRVDSQDISDFKKAFFDFDLSNAVINRFTGLYSGLENYVVGLKYYPCGLPQLNVGQSTVAVGNLLLENNGNALTFDKINGYQSSILYSGTLQLPEYYQSILDYGGYNKAWLYLPYYGSVPIDVSILRTRTLKLVYTLDIISGSATIILYIGNANGYTPMNIYSCDMGCDIPLTLQSGIELGSKVVDLSTNVLTATIGGATGGAVGAIAGGVQNITNGVDLSNMTQVCGRSNSLAMQGAPLYPSLLLMKPKYPKNYQGSYGSLVGKPACITTTLTSGYNKVLEGKPNINGCTQSEYDKLVSLLNEGVWI